MPEHSDQDSDSVEPSPPAGEPRASSEPANTWTPPPADASLKGTLIESDTPSRSVVRD
jgi:hypothetical protein